MCEYCEWQIYLEEIEELLDEEKAKFATDTLNGIADWIEENEHITENQIQAIENIKESIER